MSMLELECRYCTWRGTTDSVEHEDGQEVCPHCKGTDIMVLGIIRESPEGNAMSEIVTQMVLADDERSVTYIVKMNDTGSIDLPELAKLFEMAIYDTHADIKDKDIKGALDTALDK